MGKDHPGCTRGVSHNVGVRTTLPDLVSKKRKHEDMESLKRIMDDQEKQIKQMQEQIKMILSQQNSSAGSPGMRHSSAGSTTCLEWATDLEKPTQCELIHGPTRLACAKGVVHPIGDGILHSVPMMAGCVKVQIDMVYDEFGDMDLPVHNEEMETLKDANGAYIQWPQTDVVLHKVSNRNVTKPSHMVEKSHSRKLLISAPSQVRNEDLEAHSKRQKLPQKSKVKQSVGFNMPTKMLSRPQELQRFYVRLNSNDEWRRNGVTIETEKGVFGVDKMLITLSYDDLYDLLRKIWLESGIIAAFMSGLHSVLSQKARSNRCAFLHPDTISDNQIKVSSAQVTDLIYEAFTVSHNKNKEFYVAPYIHGDHWLLLLVLPKCRTVYVLDSTHEQSKRKPESYPIKSVLDTAILKYSSLTCPNVCAGPVTWIMAECNQQTSTWECGYYVCKWLFHFVMEQQYSFPQQTPWKKQCFTAAEVDGIAVSIVNRLSISYFKT